VTAMICESAGSASPMAAAAAACWCVCGAGMREVEDLTRDQEAVELSVLRNRQVVTTTVETVAIDGTDMNTDRLVFWMGLVLQKPSLATASQQGLDTCKAGVCE
jgi:hypothetical protein